MSIARHFVNKFKGCFKISTTAEGLDHGMVENHIGDKVVLRQFLSQICSVFKAQFCIGGQGTALKEVGIDSHMPRKRSGSELTIQLKSLGCVTSLGAGIDQYPEVGLQWFHPFFLHLRQKCKC